MSKMLSGTPILIGDSTIPGVQIHPEVKALIPRIEQACREFGLDYYPIIVEFMRYDEISELASYGGFPVRYPHWRWGMEYEELSRGYEFGRHRISEMVVNCLCPDTMVLTERGSIPADQVVTGDVVFGGNNEKRRVACVKTQPSSPTVQIKIKGFGKDVVCSPNHKWRVMSSSGLIWKEAKDIISGDVLVGVDTYNNFVKNPANLGQGDDSYSPDKSKVQH